MSQPHSGAAAFASGSPGWAVEAESEFHEKLVAGVSRGPGKTEGLGAASCMGKLLASRFAQLITAVSDAAVYISRCHDGSRYRHSSE